MSAYFYSFELAIMQVSAWPWRGLEPAVRAIADEENQ